MLRTPSGAIIAIVLGIIAMVALQLAGRQDPNGEQLWDNPADPAAAKYLVLAEEPMAPKSGASNRITNHDVTIILFSDYQCSFCRVLHRSLERLAEEDPKVRIVYRDWPIFGAASEEAARAAIASQFQGRHAAFNDALMTSQTTMGPEAMMDAARRAQLDWDRLQTDLAAHRNAINQAISRTSVAAVELRLSGTPGMIVGPYLYRGAMDYGELQDAVAKARAFNRQRK